MLDPVELEAALDLMPHRGSMRLISMIEEVDETQIICRAKPHDGMVYPLRLDGHLEPAALTELGAQAAAAHASLFGMGAAHTGLVLSMGGVEIHRDAVPENGNLRVRAEQIRAVDAAASYYFAVSTSGLNEANNADLVSGEVLLSMVRATA